MLYLSHSFHRAKKAAAKLSRLSKYEQHGSRLRIVFMDMTTIIARFSPYESIEAVREFVLDCLDDAADVARDAVLLFKYTASLDKSRDVLTPACASAVLTTGEVPPALSECSPQDTLGLVGLAPAGTIVVVWPTTPEAQTAAQGQYLSQDFRSKLPSPAAEQVRAGVDPALAANQSENTANPPSSTGPCCSIS